MAWGLEPVNNPIKHFLEDLLSLIKFYAPILLIIGLLCIAGFAVGYAYRDAQLAEFEANCMMHNNSYEPDYSKPIMETTDFQYVMDGPGGKVRKVEV
jgi:hypothetical protein